jgi:uncharacterized membrane protein (DUF106 family)
MLMVTLGIMIFVLMFRDAVGKALNVVFEPLIGFGGKYVVLTLMLAGMIMIGISTVIRTLMTDTMTQAKNQNEMKSFNAELRQARIENNLYKIKKLTEQQKVMMSKSMDSSMKMMKTMPITMVIVIPMFAWVNYFLYNVALSTIVSVPWSSHVNILESIGLPMWILMYMLVTIPFAQLIGRVIRWFKFKKRLEEIDRGIGSV